MRSTQSERPCTHARTQSTITSRDYYVCVLHAEQAAVHTQNGLRYHSPSPTGIPSHTAHRIEGRGKKGEQGSQRRLAHSAASDVAFTGASRESSGSGTLGVAVLGQGRSTQFSRPAPSHLAWYPRLSSIHRSQPLCSSEHPPKTPGPIGLSPPKNGRSGLVHPGTDDRQAASSTEYYYTSRSYTYEQKQQERALTWRCVPSSTGTPQLQLPQICVPFHWALLKESCL